VTALAANHLGGAGVRVATQVLLHLDRQAVHAAPHIGVPDRQPYPNAGRGRVFIAEPAPPGPRRQIRRHRPRYRPRTLPANSTSIAGSPPTAPSAGPAAGSGGISTCVKPFATVPNSCRDR